MNILIVGAGVVGSNLARQLSLEGQNIALVDPDEARLEDVANKIDCLTVVGDGASPQVLVRANIESADMVIAVTDNDSVNIVICMLADRYGVKHKIARVRNQEYQNLNVGWRDTSGTIHRVVDNIINPDIIIATALEQFINSPGATEVADFVHGEVQMRKFNIPTGAPLAGMKVMDLRKYTAVEPFLVVAIARGETTIVPGGEDLIAVGDEVVIVMPDGVQPFLLPLVGRGIVEVNKVIISGTTPAAIELAKRLESRVAQVMLIEENRSRAEAADAQLGRSRVFVGKSTDRELLKHELGVDTADFFVAMDEDDEHNLLGALLAKNCGAKRVAMLVREVEYLNILSQIGVDIAVNARLLTMGAILRFVRRGRIVSLAKFHGDAAEAIEMEVEKGARITGKPLKDLGIPKGAIIGAVQRPDEGVFLPNGNTVIREGDHVIVFTLTNTVSRVERLFAQRGLFG